MDSYRGQGLTYKSPRQHVVNNMLHCTCTCTCRPPELIERFIRHSKCMQVWGGGASGAAVGLKAAHDGRSTPQAEATTQAGRPLQALVVPMGDVSVIFSNIAALNLPDADKDKRDGASDPFVVFDVVVGGRTFSGRTPTRENARNVQWDEEVMVVLEGPLRISELHGVPLRISVWDDDDEEKGEADEPMGRREEKLDCNGRERPETRVLTGVGSLYSFHVSFSYRLVDSLLAAGTRARVCTWVPPVGPEAENIKVTNEGQTITRLHYRGAAAGTSVATSSPVLSGQQESTITFKIHHSDGGRGMFVGVGASTTNAAWPGRVIFLSIHSGRWCVRVLGGTLAPSFSHDTLPPRFSCAPQADESRPSACSYSLLVSSTTASPARAPTSPPTC